jgi:hypothetical protein
MGHFIFVEGALEDHSFCVSTTGSAGGAVKEPIAANGRRAWGFPVRNNAIGCFQRQSASYKEDKIVFRQRKSLFHFLVLSSNRSNRQASMILRAMKKSKRASEKSQIAFASSQKEKTGFLENNG